MKKRGYWAAAILAAVFTFAVHRIPAPIEAYASDREVETVYLETPEHVWWKSETVGQWSSVRKAHEYQVKLYLADEIDRDEDNWRTFDPEEEGLEAVMTQRTSETTCDFTEYMKDLHTYFYVVRAVPKVSEQAYVVNGDWIASPDVEFREQAVLGITEGKWRNYLEGSRYEDENGDFLPGGWQLIRGFWYLLDENGYRLTGWQEADGVRYYLEADGKMAKGWFRIGEDWYYADQTGAVQTGQVRTEPGVYYELDEEGRWNGEN